MNRGSCLLIAMLAPMASVAQNAFPANGTLLEEVLVTATKQAVAVAAQDVALAISAFSGDQLERSFAKDLQSLTVGMPNVQLDSIGTQKATANFTIRGLGTNSSIPSIEPTVGVFYDGVYLGINAGVVYDFLDVESIEVLRGPQGLLFGRNVTGGAIVIHTRRPSDEFAGMMKASVTHKLDKTVAASISGPLIEGTLAARLALAYDDDDGWFKNEYDGEDFGKSNTWIVRPSLMWNPGENIEILVRFEHGKYDGQGSAYQNRSPALAAFEGRHDRHSHSFNINEEGFGIGEWDMVIGEVNAELGSGTLTNIFGWRTYEDDALSDIDGRPTTAFDTRFLTDQEQMSNELRYALEIGERVKLTSGIYWFEQDLAYFETRAINTSPTADPAAQVIGHLGGVQESTTTGVFASADIDLTAALVLNLGARYTEEEKQVKVAPFSADPALDPCPAARVGGVTGIRVGVPNESNCTFSFRDRKSWSDVTPKVGLQYFIADDIQAYGFATKGFRSGGYNLRNTLAAIPPGPFDPEEQLSYELGLKADWAGGALRTNAAVFYNEIEDMQREVSIAAGPGVVAQVIRNTADATLQGVELEVVARVTPDFVVTANVGYVDGQYDAGSLKFDISGDGVINETDEKLDIPRLAPLTWGLGFALTVPIGQTGVLGSRVAFNHRDRAAWSDNNLGTLNTVDMLDASVSLVTLEERLTIAAFGKNLTNRVIEGNDAQLPAIPAFSGAFGTRGSLSPLMKGRVYGLELVYKL